METKVCIRCKITRRLHRFAKDLNNQGNRLNVCVACVMSVNSVCKQLDKEHSDKRWETLRGLKYGNRYIYGRG